MNPTDAPNLNYAWCGLIVEELIRQGVAGFVISPGSRSAPLTVSVARNTRAKYWIHYDERGAGFFALGLAKATGKPAVLICTSGSAVANYWPAVVEAAMDHVPLILLTADRPPELVDCGANQAIDQTRIYGDYARWYAALPCPTADCPPTYVLTTTDQAWQRSQFPLAGPVHVNVPLRDPLDPKEDESVAKDMFGDLSAWVESELPFTRYDTPQHQLPDRLGAQLLRDVKSSTQGLVIVGRLDNPNDAVAIRTLIASLQWKVYADITSGLYGPDTSKWLLTDVDEFILDMGMHHPEWSPDCILHLGGSYTSKALLTFLKRTPAGTYLHIANTDQRLDPNHQVTQHISMAVDDFSTWLANNLGDRKAVEADPTTASDTAIPERLTEPAVAQLLSGLVPEDSLLFAGSSMPIRLVEKYFRPIHATIRVAANRGASGIDGNIATALGMAAGRSGATTILVGDLTALHDLNSLVLHKHVEGPVLLIVLNNDGGGIFHYLPIAQSQEPCFDACFGTPHGLNFQGAAQMFGLKHTAPKNPAEFGTAYNDALADGGATLIEVRTNRYEARNHLSGHPNRMDDTTSDRTEQSLKFISENSEAFFLPDALRPEPLAGDPGNPPLLLIHGFMGNRDDWQDLAQEFETTHYVLGVNLPGHGPGWDGFPVDFYDMSACAAALNTHLDNMGLGPCALLGYSMGGRFAFYLATLFPDRYVRVILESASPGLETEEKRAARQAQDLAIAQRLDTMQPDSQAYRDFLEEWYNLPLFESLHKQPSVRQGLIDRRVAVNYPKHLAQSLACFGTGSQPNLWPFLKTYRTPTLLLVGEMDRKYRVIAEDMCAACPAMAIEVFAGCGHIPHLESPKPFVTSARSFLINA